MTDNKSIEQRLLNIQQSLIAPKEQFNKFGGYSYRTAEDILAYAKPLLDKENLLLSLTDEIVLIGDRFYVKATAVLQDIVNHEQRIKVTAFAREPFAKKGMDESQITGSTSSYARKYALNGLFLIDDNKDPDSSEYHVQGQGQQKQRQTKPKQVQTQKAPSPHAASREEVQGMFRALDQTGISADELKAEVKRRFNVVSSSDLTSEQVALLIDWMANTSFNRSIPQ